MARLGREHEFRRPGDYIVGGELHVGGRTRYLRHHVREMLELASHRSGVVLTESVGTSTPMRNDALVLKKAVAINWSRNASAHALSSL